MIETTWMSESSILLLLETEFLTSKSCDTLWKKSMHEHMWLIFAVATCNYLLEIFLTFWLGKPSTHMLFMWGLCDTIKLLHYSHIYIYTYNMYKYIMIVHPSKCFKSFYCV